MPDWRHQVSSAEWRWHPVLGEHGYIETIEAATKQDDGSTAFLTFAILDRGVGHDVAREIVESHNARLAERVIASLELDKLHS